MNQASLGSSVRPVRRNWNALVGRHPVGRPLRENFIKHVDRIRKLSFDQFPEVVESRDRRKASLMAGRSIEGERRKRAAEGDRTDPSKRQASSSSRSRRPPTVPKPDMRSLVDRSRRAMDQAAADRASGRGTGERRSTSSEVRSSAASGKDHTAQKSQGRSEDLPRRTEQRTEGRERIATLPRPVETEKEQVAEVGSSAKYPVSLGVDPAPAEKNPALDKGKAVDACGDQPSAGGAVAPKSNHIFDSSSARENFLQFRYDGPGRLYQDKEACSELIYSVRGVEEGYPELKDLAEREAYEQYARTHVRNLAQLNDMIACYDYELAKARKAAEDEKTESARLRAEVEEMRATSAQAEELKATNERLKNRLRYLKEIEEPSRKMVQVRGVLKVLEHFRDKMAIEVPEMVTNKLERDLVFYKGKVDKVAEAKLNDEDLV